MGEKYNTPDPGTGQSPTTDEAAQRGMYMKIDNIKGEAAGAAGPPTAGADATRMAIGDQGVAEERPPKHR